MHIYLIPSPNIVIGFDSNKFHGFGALTCLAGYLIFYKTKLSQMMNWSAPLRRARRADRNGYIICYIWSSELKDINFINKRKTPHHELHD